MTYAQPAVPTPNLDPTGPIKQVVESTLRTGATSVLDGLGQWLFQSLADITGAVFGFIDRATTPNLSAGWFLGTEAAPGPYRAMVSVAATVMVGLAFAGVLQGLVQGDLGGMVRRMVVAAPTAVLGMTATVVVAQVLIDVTDEISRYLTANVGGDVGAFTQRLTALATASGAPAAPTMILGLLMLMASLVVFVELLVRSLLIYVIVALSPLAWAALVWPAIQGALKKTLELLVAVILSKMAVALALAVGAAAVAGVDATTVTGAGTAGGAGQGMTESLGLLATGVATLALAAFSPFLIAKLLPFAESAAVAQGTRGAPVRAAQQVWNAKYQLDVARRFQGGGRGGGQAGGGGFESADAAGDGAEPGGAAGGAGGGRIPGLGGAGTPGGAGAAGTGAGAGGAVTPGVGAGAGAGGGAGAGAGASAGAGAAAGPAVVVVGAASAAKSSAQAAHSKAAGSTEAATDPAGTGAPPDPTGSGPTAPSSGGGGGAGGPVLNRQAAPGAGTAGDGEGES